MTNARFLLAILSMFLLGFAAGAVAHHREGSSYALPVMLIVCGLVAALLAWKLDTLVRRPDRPPKD
jgi:hypothetical protein